jgi:hypothetical protein
MAEDPRWSIYLADGCRSCSSGISSSIEYRGTGKLRALAVTTATRSAVRPDVQSMADFLPGYEASAWFGLGAPKNTPAKIVDTLNSEFNAGLADPKQGATCLSGFLSVRYWGEGKYGGVEQIIITPKTDSRRALSSVLQNVFDAWMTPPGKPLPPISEH